MPEKPKTTIAHERELRQALWEALWDEVKRLQSNPLPGEVFSTVLTVEKFSQWLENQPVDTVFPTGHAQRCPLSAYLADTYHVSDVGVGFRKCHIGSQSFDLPLWAQTFVIAFDRKLYRGNPPAILKLLREVNP